MSAGEQARPDIVRAVRAPSTISTNAGVVGTNVALALATLVVMLATAAIFNQTLEENDHEIRAFLSSLAKPFAAAAASLAPAAGAIGREGLQIRWLGPMIALGLAALLFGLEDLSFSFSDSTIVLTLSFLVTFAVLLYVYEGGQLLMTNRYGLPATIRVFPAGVAIAIICVALSRAQGFEPGLVFGFVAAHSLTVPTVMSKRQLGHQVFWPMLVLLGVSVVAWLLADPARELAEDGDTMWAALPEGIAIGLFLAGVEGIFLQMIPLRFMDGHKLITWNKAAWLFIAVASGFLFWHAMMNEEKSSLDALGQTSTMTLVILMGTALLIAAATHTFFRIRNGRTPEVV